ncbi:MAG: T9SS type A sorting domain-containing protein [Bacteroidales bacterium]|nr:T9SS type A sorting domain-containing protein [Bacteroidales bacterium]
MTGSVNVTIDPLPVAYSVTGGGPYCIGGTGVEVGLSGSEVGIDYQLQKDGSNIGTAVSGTGSAISFGNQTEAGNYTVVATNTTTGCINSMTGSVDVVINPLPTPVISGDQQVCENDQGLSYSTPYIDGHNYNWLVTGGSIAYGQNTHSIIVDWGSVGTGTVKVLETIDATGCDSTSSDYSVTIYPLPSTPTITGELSYCAGSTTTLISSAGVGYLWSTGEATQSIDVGESDYSVQTTDVNGCQSYVSSTVTVTEIPLPTATISGDAAICDDGSEAIITVNLTGTAPWEITYQIDGANDSIITNINSSPYKFNTLIPGQYLISQVSDIFCTGNSFGSVTITVNPLPDVKIIGLYTYYNINKDTVNLNATPPGGNFYGSSGIDDYEKVFKPSDAGLGDHNIIYTYTDNNLCTNYDTVKVTVIDAEGEITSLSGNDDFIYCYDGAIDTIQGSSAGGEIGGRFSGNGIDSIDLDLATFNPILAGPGTHRIIYTYIKDSVALDIVEFFTVDSIGEIDFIGLDQEYCINNEAVELTPILPTDGGGSGTMAFSGSTGISVDIFDPGSAVIGIDTVTLTYIRDYSGCKKILNKTVQVYDIPHLDFTISDGCVNERDSTIFFNLTSSIDPVITWEWDFDDPASLGENTSDQMTPKHQYPGFGRRSIEMIGVTDKNCRDTLVRDIDFEEKPLAGFEWENECYSENKSIPFRDKTFSNSPITDYLWKFYDTNGTDTLATYNTKDTDFVFPTQSDYSIELIVNTANGCTDTINQTIQLRPTIRLIDEVYFEDFESGPQGWIAEAADFSVNSWEFGLPSNNIINSAASGNTAWVTDLNGNYFDSEDSWITSPCFDFREMNRPMIKMNILINSEGDRDGAILQFSTNNGIDWNRVGEYGDDKGLGWFNSVGILGNPGGQQQGWSGTGNNDWQEVRHDLDPLIGSNGVQFRVAFGAGAEGNMEGFAFDNVWIGERTRKVILEHFTNTAESQSEKADSTVNAIANKDTLDVIDIQYHTNFPGSNVLNEYYPAGPGARAIYYGISDVPYSVMDGWEYFEGFDDQDNYLWKESNLIKRSLNDPQVQVNLNAKILNGTTLSIDVKVDTLKSIPSNHEVTLHIVILENQVEEGDKTYENVIRKMLPDPGGTPITTGLSQGSVLITESWLFNVSEIDPAALIVVAFVQDEETREIFQAASVNYTVITGITFPVSGIRELSFKIYPNPSSGKTYLLFSEPLQEDYSLRIFNNLGALIENKVLRNGVQYHVLDTENYQNGIYFIRIMKGNKTIGIKRLSIIH